MLAVSGTVFTDEFELEGVAFLHTTGIFTSFDCCWLLCPFEFANFLRRLLNVLSHSLIEYPLAALRMFIWEFSAERMTSVLLRFSSDEQTRI